MLREIKKNFKRSSPSLSLQERPPMPQVSASTPVLTNYSQKMTPNRSRDNSINTHSGSTSNTNNTSHNNSSSSNSSSSSRSRSSSSNSSNSSLSMPPTPTHQTPNRSSSSIHSDYLMNHSHLKPGTNAELLSYDKTITMYRENAKRTNDPHLQHDLAAFIYESCKNKLMDTKQRTAYMTEAVKMFKTLALRGHAPSQYYLANIYASGALHKSNKPNFNSAFPLFVQAAKHQHADAAYRAAKCYEDGLGCLKNRSKAVQYYKLASTLNHPGAMYRLGMACIHGDLGLQRNVREGNKWLKRSAEAATPEYPHALHEFGLLHEKGLDDIIFKDPSYAIRLYRQAADLGYAPSAYRLGQCYEHGYLGCRQDIMTSMSYYQLAARQEHPEACFALSVLHLTGDPPRVPASEEKAYHWARLAALKGLPKAEFALGYYAEKGIGRPQDSQDAMCWYQKAAHHGDARAKQRISQSPSMVAN